MGGMSFKCNLCDKWFLSPGSFRDHLSGKHGLHKIKFEGIGSCVEITEATMKTASWIIRDKFTGRVEYETFDNADAELINLMSSNLEAVPVLQHLQELNTPGTLARKWMMR